MKTSFKKTPPETTAEAPATETQIATREPHPVSTALAANDMAGFNTSDVRWPRINLIQKSSDETLISKFGLGSFVFNKEIKLSDGKTPVRIIALQSGKDYQQKLPFGSPETPAVFKTPEEVEAAGGSLDWKDKDNGNFFQPRAHAQMMVEMPAGTSESDAALFPYEYNGKQYGVAIITVASSGFTSFGKELATLRNNNKVMRQGLRYGALDLTSESRKNARNSWFVPVIKFVGANDPELVKFFEGLL